MTPGKRRASACIAGVLSLVLLISACGGGSSSSKPQEVPQVGAGLQGATAKVAAPKGPTLSPPASIPSNCSTDVSSSLQSWFSSLPPDTTVVAKSGACYLVDSGIVLDEPTGLTVYGGTFRDDSTSVPQAPHSKGHPVFTVLGGSAVTLEEMTIKGANTGGYHARLAFAGGIELEGTADPTVRSVTVTDTFGDGITLAPLRGGRDHNSGQILSPVTGATLEDLTIDRVGRQGITFASVTGARVGDVVIRSPGIDTFDFEADQAGEGATNVTIDGCEASGGAIFFANGGAGSSPRTSEVTVRNCTMDKPEGGSAILIVGRPQSATLRGPFIFTSDRLWCGASAYVACVQLTRAEVTLSGDTLLFPSGTTHEAVYHLAGGSHATFQDDVVHGYGRKGQAVVGSSVQVSGGNWNGLS
jgi:hypothetical protein